MRKQHFNGLPLVAADLVGFRLPAGAGEVPRVLMFFSTDRPADRVGAALLFRRAPLTVRFQSAVFARAADVLAAIGVRVIPAELLHRKAYGPNAMLVGNYI